MSKPIKLTDELKQAAVEEFAKTLAGLKMSDGKVSYTKNFTYGEDDKAQILFTPLAYTKMVSLITSYTTEVAWHGVGQRVNGAKFLITDILVYPQTVAGGTVEMDTDAYAKWIIDNIEDDRFNHIIMQGHSHVNASTKPSSVDLKHQDDILAMLTDDMYYIFLIWNKRLEHTAKIYDLQNNTLYEDKDISYGIADEDFDVEGFIAESKPLVKERAKNTTYGGNYGGSNYGGTTYGGTYGGSTYGQQAKTNNNGVKSKQKGTSDYGSGWNGRGSEYAEDNATGFFPVT